MSAIIEPVSRDRWRELTGLFQDHNYRQLWDFGAACAERIGGGSEHVAILAGREVLGLADVRIKSVPILGTGIAYITGGPLVQRADGGHIERFEVCLRALADEYVTKKGLVLRIQPPLGSPEWNGRVEECFAAAGFHLSKHGKPYRTLVVDINRPLEDIRSSLDRKWRNHLNRAERNGLSIHTGTSAQMLSAFGQLYAEMLMRKHFEVDLDPLFYAQVQGKLAESEQFEVVLASVDGQPAAGHVFSILGDTCVSLLGASNEAGMKSKASYLQQWHIIQAAKERCCRRYDLGGIDPEKNPGVYEFKQGMSGIDLTAPGPFEAVPGGAKRYVTAGLERAYRAVRRSRVRQS